jgi:hypothetical protein
MRRSTKIAAGEFPFADGRHRSIELMMHQL